MKDDMMTPTNNSQFVISYELLYLLQWIVEHGSDELKQLVGKALAAGLREQMHHIDNEAHIAEEMQDSIVDFFSLLEGLLAETVNEQAMLKAHEKNLMPALDHIDSTVCDDATVRTSLEKATTKMSKNPDANAQQLLFEELLKRWKPHKKAKMN